MAGRGQEIRSFNGEVLSALACRTSATPCIGLPDELGNRSRDASTCFTAPPKECAEHTITRVGRSPTWTELSSWVQWHAFDRRTPWVGIERRRAIAAPASGRRQ